MVGWGLSQQHHLLDWWLAEKPTRSGASSIAVFTWNRGAVRKETCTKLRWPLQLLGKAVALLMCVCVGGHQDANSSPPNFPFAGHVQQQSLCGIFFQAGSCFIVVLVTQCHGEGLPAFKTWLKI